MNLLAALCILSANFVGTSAFSYPAPDGIPERPSHLMPTEASQRALPGGEGDHFEIFPTYDKLETLESGGTVRTYQMPSWATRVQMRFETNGRPMRGEVNLWLGPERKTHTLKIDTESGKQFPVQALLKFKKGPPVLKVSTTELANYPMKVGIHVPSAERAAELERHTETLWDNSDDDKQLIQGANTDGKYGQRVNWQIPDNVDSVQLLGWSRDSGRKSFKVEIELLQGPNNVRQAFFLQCGGGSQPYHAVYQTPGKGWTVRIRNKKFVEDGLVQIAVKPYEMSKIDPSEASGMSWDAGANW